MISNRVRAGLRLSMTDIARLASVQRPVVSMWRRRYATAERPFPSPVARLSRQELFDAEEVLDWLEATGRAEGGDLREDAAVHALPTGLNLSTDPVAFAALTALLALKASTDAALDGLTDEQLYTLAVSVDPLDTHLVREVQALGAHLATLTTYADELADAAYSPSAALEGLLAERFRHDANDLATLSLAGPVHDLVVALTRGLGDLLDAEDPSYLDPTGVGSDLLLSVVDAVGDLHPDVFLTASDDQAARLFRRRATARGLLLSHAPAALNEAPAAVMLAHYPVIGSPHMTPLEILDAVDELVLSMGDHQYAVVIAPATVLVDRLRDRATRQLREQVLRTGRLRAALRLPAGLVTQRPRQSLAVWVLGTDPTDVSLGDRRVALGHLTSPIPTTAGITGVVDDVIASASSLAGAHHYSHLSLVRTATLLASSSSLVPSGRPHSTSPVSPAELALGVAELSAERTFPGPLQGMGVEASRGASAPRTTSLTDALDAGAVRVIGGNRAGFDLADEGSVPVVGVPELNGDTPSGSRRVDRMAFLGAHPSSRLTQPGDVVFCTAPRPRALVDAEGGSAVQYPARLLRLNPVKGEGHSPYVIASTIASQPPDARDWRRWTVPVLPATQVQPVDEALTAVETQRQELRRRLTELDTLTDLVIAGVSSHSFTLQRTDSPEHPQKEGT